MMRTARMLQHEHQLDPYVFLMAEDDPADQELFRSMLEQAFGTHYSIVCVDSFASIQLALQKGHFEALILDMNLPDRSGVDNVSQLGNHFPELPIVVLTGQDDLETAIEALKRGAQDYLTKNNVTPEVLVRSLRYAQERKQIELRLRQALNETAIQNSQLEKMAKLDFLTELPNRAFFETAAARSLGSAKRANKLLALLYLDLNDFKKVNDNFGHGFGDELLRKVAARLKNTLRDTDLIARIGGDEFVILTDLLETKREVNQLVHRVSECFIKPFKVLHQEVSTACSIGVSFYPEATDLPTLMKQADLAMYEAKEALHTPVCFFTSQMEAYYTQSLQIESQLPTALRDAEFSVVFQPVFELQDCHPNEVSAEALLRWHSSVLGQVSPNDFIPIVENGPIINQLTQIVLAYSAMLIKQLDHQNHQIGRIKINITASQMNSHGFTQLFLAWLEEFGISADAICIELTEREIVKNSLQTHENLNILRNAGVSVALDDFGSGFSSIKHLMDLPIDYLKLDRLLIAGIDTDLRNQALTAGIIEMAHRLDIVVIAEGVETEAELQMVRNLGCDSVQGFLLGKPQPIDVFMQGLAENPPD